MRSQTLVSVQDTLHVSKPHPSKHKYINTLKICRYVTQHELIQNYKWYNKNITVYNYMYTPYCFFFLIILYLSVIFCTWTLLKKKKKHITKYSFVWCVLKHDLNWSRSCVIEIYCINLFHFISVIYCSQLHTQKKIKK